MNLKHLQTFLILSEYKNFTKTADHLHYAQSNVTTQIQLLEKELNVKLFERIGKSVTLTSAGYELLPYANRMHALSNDVKKKFSDDMTSRIVIGASESICLYRLPDIIKSYQSMYPNVEVYLQVLDTPDYLSLLESNTIDIAFVLDKNIMKTNYKIAYKNEEDICVIAQPSHPLAHKGKVSMQDFDQQRLILTGKDCCYRKEFEKAILSKGIHPKIVLETGSLHVIKQLALNGLGLCVLPTIAIHKELASGEFVKLKYPMPYGISSQLIYHKDKWLTNEMQNFIRTVQDYPD